MFQHEASQTDSTTHGRFGGDSDVRVVDCDDPFDLPIWYEDHDEAFDAAEEYTLATM